MTTEISTSRPQMGTLGSEEYSLYSSMSEEELIQMAIEQSLTDSSSGQATAQGHQKLAVAGNAEAAACSRPNRAPHPSARLQSSQVQPNSKSRPVQPSGSQPPSAGSGRGVRRRYDGSLFTAPHPVEQDPIVTAIKNGDDKTLTDMIKSGINLSEPSKEGWLPLHDASYYGQLECLKLLLKAYPSTIDRRTLQEETALYLATVRGHIDCLTYLLHCSAEPDIANKSRETPLYKASEYKNVDAVKLLVQYNADVNHRCNRGWTALHEAVARNDLEIAEILVTAGAKIEAKNAYGITPLFVAAQSGQMDALRYLAKCGADINTQANDSASALYEASKNGHTGIVAFLLAQGADANRANKDGFLPLHIAAKKKDNEETVSMLIPVTSRIRIKRSGISPLHIAAERNNNNSLEELIDAGYDVNATLSFERARLYEDRRSTALYFSVINNNIDATEMLLDAGANPNVDIINPLLISIRHGCLKTMMMLLDHGANIDAYIATHPTSFPATIMFAMKYLSLLKFLMDFGCDADSCFNCEYGNGPHPPVEDTRRREYEAQNPVNKQPKIIQFCEMVSTPEFSRWAGPIIDVLLDYVGNVQLCARLQEHIDSYEDWADIKRKAEPPRPLTHLCRLKVRNIVGRSRLELLDTLPLPHRLIQYLKYEC
ncbi:ankyrin repeat and SOCS box protein 2 [Rhinatrema bivittatum]|uniref:ankyrin repeat and SOCS box protein 2 n=1 Tax=Rhinatrema bivittatum TaxID=194408 RepID=UPI00112A8077|nr:ankyrin repeat and SOCS box protein 2 [Rhinatrema bivittatum]XP_029453719.1 ankyrin repeat and SOCS box protein 2 [Rhinatrema bivittatum]XP_029453720.1 ankyrin repeat and SOCS box protein 2 [Rhinatrema bivittatum]XP_029453722.1 ankyrin repeat and SOCS box protein 2 [Rhinatrema bivittatum]XP_029453723.1 ankyrin repeat and SOCS box protein 2 [Rhinatrema bivittatum]